MLVVVEGDLGIKVELTVVAQENIVPAVAVGAGGNAAVAIAAVEVPFADVAGAVAVVAQHFAEVLAFAGQHAGVVAEGAVLKRMLSAEEHAAHGRADGGRGDAVLKPDAFACYAVEVRRLDLLVAVAPEHVKRLLISENKQQVGLSAAIGCSVGVKPGQYAGCCGGSDEITTCCAHFFPLSGREYYAGWSSHSVSCLTVSGLNTRCSSSSFMYPVMWVGATMPPSPNSFHA